MAVDCVFCQIMSGEKRGEIVYSDEEIVALRDVNPQAPVHVLILPREHIVNVNQLTDAHIPLLGRMYLVAREVASNEGVEERGYRLVVNTNREAGQSVYHLHMHLLGGRRMSWPPG